MELLAALGDMGRSETMRPARLALLLAASVALAGCFPEDRTQVNSEESPSDTDPPLIVNVRGNSALNPVDAAEGPSLFRNGIIIEGERLSGAPSVHLERLGGGVGFTDLNITKTLDTQLDVTFPAELGPGSYRLIVLTSGGERRVILVIQEGERGPDGPDELEGVPSWEELEALLPPAEDFLASADAAARYILASEAEAYETTGFAATEELEAWPTTDDILAEFAAIAETPVDESGYPTADQLVDTYAAAGTLPDPAGAALKSALPNFDAYLSLDQANAAGVPIGTASENFYQKAQLADEFVLRDVGFQGGQLAEIEALIDAEIAALPAPSCGASSVDIGGVCVDEFEARIRLGECSADTALLGQAPGDLDEYLNPGGEWVAADAKPVACSSEVGTPSGYTNWFQARALCSARGARLCTNPEWQRAAAGTSDAPESGCATNNEGPADGSGTTGCLSAAGARDMIGNVAEWTADWFPGGPTWETGEKITPPSAHAWPGAPPELGEISYWVGSTRIANNAEWFDAVPAALVRGGHYNEGTAAGAFTTDASLAATTQLREVGFRCCQDL